MTPAATPPTATALQAGLTEPDPATRLQAALAAGMRPDPDFVDVLIQRCGVEPDFYVRDMLTWALTRHPRALTVPQLVDELGRDAIVAAQPGPAARCPRTAISAPRPAATPEPLPTTTTTRRPEPRGERRSFWFRMAESTNSHANSQPNSDRAAANAN